MDMYKKRTAGRIAQVRIPKKGLADFEEDGYTVVIPRRSDKGDHDADRGDHFVPASEALEPGERKCAAIESRSETLEEMGSAERSILGEPGEHSQSECARDVNLAQGQQSGDGRTIRVVISRQQLAKLLAEASIKNSSGCKALFPQSALQTNGRLVGMAQIISYVMDTTQSPGSPWPPRLDTITEAPLQLTRSPVITRNCETVEHFLQTKT